jgi:peroxiredoxin
MKPARTILTPAGLRRPAARAALAAITIAAMLAGCDRLAQAPDVRYTLLDGHVQHLAELRGRVVLVNFWASDCAPCVAEMPRFVQTWRRFSPRGYDTLAVSLRQDPPAQVIRFAESRKLPFGVVMDLSGEFAERFGHVEATPTTVLIDKRGREVARWAGPTDFDALDKRLAQLLEE